MRRSFRVGTVFTGAAACAAVMAPAAHAAAGATVTKAATGAEAAAANITAGNCPTNASTAALHLYYPASKDHPTAACVAGTPVSGLIWSPAKPFQYYCGGQYSGSFQINHEFVHFTHGAGKHNLYGAHISAIILSKVNTTGAHTCPGTG